MPNLAYPLINGSRVSFADISLLFEGMPAGVKGFKSINYSDELAPANATFHNNLGVSLDRTGRRAEAIAAYTRSLELRPRDAATLQIGTEPTMAPDPLVRQPLQPQVREPRRERHQG